MVKRFFICLLAFILFGLIIMNANKVSAAVTRKCSQCTSTNITTLYVGEAKHQIHCNNCSAEYIESCSDYGDNYNGKCDICLTTFSFCSACEQNSLTQGFYDNHSFHGNDGCKHAIKCEIEHYLSDPIENCVDYNLDDKCDICGCDICTDKYCIMYKSVEGYFHDCRNDEILTSCEAGDTFTFLSDNGTGKLYIGDAVISIGDGLRLTMPYDCTLDTFFDQFCFSPICDVCTADACVEFESNDDGTHTLKCINPDCNDHIIKDDVSCVDFDNNHLCDFCSQSILYSISFDINGATGTAPTDEDLYIVSDQITLPEIGSITKTDHKFVGWSTDKTATIGNTDNYTIVSDDVIDGAIKFYAIWKEKDSAEINADPQYYEFDSNVIKFSVSGTPASGYTVEYFVDSEWTSNVPSEIGSYSVKISRDADNDYKEFSQEITNGLIITKIKVAEPVVSGTYTYNGKEQTVTFTGVTSYMSSESSFKGTNVDEYTITFILTDTDNYEWKDGSDGVVTWNIVKAKVNEPKVSGTYTYNGSEQTVTLTGVESFMSIVNTSVSKATKAGNYSVSYTLDNNHEWNTGSDGIVNWSIAKANYNMTNVKWGYTSAFTFDGEEKEVKLNGLPQGVTATYSNNSKCDAGSYLAKATLSFDSANYNAPTVNNLSWAINPLEVSISWVEKTFLYNGNAQTITAYYMDIYENTISLNVNTDAEFKEVGTYTATASFKNSEKNYKLPANASKEYSITAESLVITSQTITDPEKQPEVGTKAELLEGSLDPGCSVVISKEVCAPSEEIIQNVKAEFGDKSELILVFDIHIEDSTHYEISVPGNKYQVTIAIPSELSGRTGYAIICINDDDTIEKFDGVVNGNKLTFETTHFSTWGVVADEAKKGPSVFGVILIILLVLILLFVGVYFVWKFVFKKNKYENETLNKIIDFLDKVFIPVDKWVMEAHKNVKEWCIKAWKAVSTWCVKAWNVICKWCVKAWNAICEWCIKTWNAVSKWFKDLIEKIKGDKSSK